jgi:hypothetical protein
VYPILHACMTLYFIFIFKVMIHVEWQTIFLYKNVPCNNDINSPINLFVNNLFLYEYPSKSKLLTILWIEPLKKRSFNWRMLNMSQYKVCGCKCASVHMMKLCNMIFFKGFYVLLLAKFEIVTT